MARPTRIPSQPDLSPTYSPASPSRSTAEPVRRNLFSAHLSRRPISSQPEQQQPPPPSQYRNISPFASPPRLTPTTELPPSLSGTYDPSQSPHRPLSPRTSASIFPSNSIVAINPATGRPLIPQLPTLPAHLTLEDDEEEDDELEEEELSHGDEHGHASPQHLQYTTHLPPSRPPPDPFTTDYPAHDPHLDYDATYSQPRRQHHDSHTLHHQTHPYPEEDSVRPYAAEAAHINDLMSRYRARHQSQPQSQTHQRTQSQQHHQKVQQHASLGQHQRVHSHATARQPFSPTSQTAAAAAGEEEEDDPVAAEEKAELMAHLMAKLRRVVESAEADAWMFGEADSFAAQRDPGGLGIDGGGAGGAGAGNAGVTAGAGGGGQFGGVN
jgi:hypothetical protein